MQTTLLANPHSDSLNPSASAIIVAKARDEVLKMFNADPVQFEVVFTANATAAIKLVMDSFSGYQKGFDYYYHRNSHTSLVGVRELAIRSRCFASEEETEEWLTGHSNDAYPRVSDRPTLFAYPAQSNMNGERLPLDWAGRVRHSLHHPDTYTLLDAAALVSTAPLDLSNHVSAPDFVALSFYKIFGFPDLGCLIIRKASGHVFDHRRYFGGGTTEMITCIDDSWVARKQSSLHVRLEDGTIAIRSILALRCAIKTHYGLFGDLKEVSRHTSWLAQILHKRLSNFQHANSVPVCQIYKAPTSTYGDPDTQGATVAFNVRRSDSSWLGCWHVGGLLRDKGIHVRTGNLCNPAGMACALGVDATWLRNAFTEDFRCNTEIDVLHGVPIGMVRVTLGAMSTLKDIHALVKVISDNLVERHRNMRTLSEGVVDAFHKEKQSPETPELGKTQAIRISKDVGTSPRSGKLSSAFFVSRTRRLWPALRTAFGGFIEGRRRPES